MPKQLTLKDSFSLSGKGLHSGIQTTATFQPAEAGEGITFIVNSDGKEAVIPAKAEYVSQTQRGTVLTKDGASIATIEHAMAALYAHDIDNCTIRVSAPEMPILDGSAILYANEINRVGVQEQDLEKDYFVVREKMEFKTENGSSIVLLPDDRFSIYALVEYDSPVLGNQFAVLNELQDFDAQIAMCRTFVFVREIEPLLQHGLIRGGDLDNAIVIYDKAMDQAAVDNLTGLMNMPPMKIDQLGYLNKRPLVFENEPARHKLLDVMGDLALIGKPILGKVIATRPGHSTNTSVAKKIRTIMRKQLAEAPYYNPENPPLYNADQIKQILPHRWPMLLVDRVAYIDGKTIVAVKSITGTEWVFQGHFPEEGIMPGVLIIEAMAQAGGVLLLSQVEDPKIYSTYFLRIDEVRFRQKVVPGDTMVMKVRLDGDLHRGIGTLVAQAFVGKTLVTEAKLMAQIAANK